MKPRLLIFGAGYSGQAIAKAFNGRAEWIGGTTRSGGKFEALRSSGVEPFLFDGTTLSDELAAAMQTTTHLVQSIAPGEMGDPLLGLIGNDLKTHFPALRWVAYLSTVGVYGDHEGAWVDEASDCHPVSDRSIMRLTAETAWSDAGVSAHLPVAILRLSGIYGPGRNAILNLQNGTAKRLIKPGQVFNRIHVEDIAGATRHLMAHEAAGIFNVTDDEPAPPQDVVSFAAELLGVQPPPEQDFGTAELSPMARSFYGENKRVSNVRLKETGYVFRFPDYRTALRSLANTERLAGNPLPAQ
ncbi:SDR family oxidoreductase [Georhizobium profundi]|uniref:SDR family oxidoreductase n=1 Tax=Georhizobium profundi TaxID=2341112 RepID=A0A3S9AZG7_9HYPH|nr:SDR family NAD(P)-dependent oxidoreductase [Georhizobium profundi]AZN70090.1 SDR family oxidoreductase [Georhizobium profundi]